MPAGLVPRVLLLLYGSAALGMPAGKGFVMTRPSASPRQHGDRRLFAVQLGLCLVMLVLRILDLLLFTDPATGFVETGWFGLRILLPAAVRRVGLPHGAARCAPPAGACSAPARRLAARCLALGWRWRRPARWNCWPAAQWRGFRRRPPCSARYGALCTARGLSARWPTPLPGCLVPFGRCPAWLLCFGAASTVLRWRRLPSCGWDIRCGCSARWRALLFLVVLFRVFFTPGLPVGRSLYAHRLQRLFVLYLPRTAPGCVWAAVRPGDSGGAGASLAFGLLGVAGLACAWYASGEGAPLPADTKPARTTT